MDPDQLYWFYREYEQARQGLQGPEYGKPDVSQDDLDVIAMWVVARGEKTYLDIFDHPEKMPSKPPSRHNSLGFNGMAEQVYADRFGTYLSALVYRVREADLKRLRPHLEAMDQRKILRFSLQHQKTLIMGHREWREDLS